MGTPADHNLQELLFTTTPKFVAEEPRDRLVIIGLPPRMKRACSYFWGDEPLYFLPSDRYGLLREEPVYVGKRTLISEAVYQYHRVVRRLLQERGWRINQVAKVFGVTHGTIHFWMRPYCLIFHNDRSVSRSTCRAS